MKITAALILLTACTAEPAPMKVMTYNIKHGELSSLEQIADFIKEEAPLVVALQEADYLTERSGRTAQVDRLGDLTGLQPFYFQSDHAFGAGNGFLVGGSVEVGDTYNIKLPGTEDTNPRAMAVMEVEINGEPYLLINVHLSYVRSDREMQMRQLIDYVARHKEAGYDIVLFGDFNKRDHSSIPLTECTPTSSVPEGALQETYIDAVMVSSLSCLDSVAVHNGLSDHPAIVATVE